MKDKPAGGGNRVLEVCHNPDDFVGNIRWNNVNPPFCNKKSVVAYSCTQGVQRGIVNGKAL